MVEKLDDVWASRDLPVLVEVARRIDGGKRPATVDAVAEATGLPSDEVRLAAAALKRRNLVETMDSLAGVIGFTGISGDAYMLTGLHPSSDDAVTAFVDALRQAADRVDDPDERSRLRRLADGVLGVSTDVIGAVLGTVATRAMGM